MRSSEVKFYVCVLELKRYLSDAVYHAESNGVIFMLVSSLQRPEKCIKKISACNFRRVLDK